MKWSCVSSSSLEGQIQRKCRALFEVEHDVKGNIWYVLKCCNMRERNCGGLSGGSLRLIKLPKNEQAKETRECFLCVYGGVLISSLYLLLEKMEVFKKKCSCCAEGRVLVSGIIWFAIEIVICHGRLICLIFQICACRLVVLAIICLASYVFYDDAASMILILLRLRKCEAHIAKNEIH
jgi:hypothetical protein